MILSFNFKSTKSCDAILKSTLMISLEWILKLKYLRSLEFDILRWKIHHSIYTYTMINNLRSLIEHMVLSLILRTLNQKFDLDFNTSKFVKTSCTLWL